MGFFDFLKKKKKEEPAPDAVTALNTDMLEGIEPPETRYTREYKDFLASQEQEERCGEAPEEEENEEEQGFE